MVFACIGSRKERGHIVLIGHAVTGWNLDWVAAALQHPLLDHVELRGSLVAVSADQPYEVSMRFGIESILNVVVVDHEGECPSDGTCGMTLSPVDDLQCVGPGDLVDGGCAAGLGRAPFLEEDAKSGVIFLPAAVVLPHRFHLDAVHDITVPSHRLNVRLSAVEDAHAPRRGQGCT